MLKGMASLGMFGFFKVVYFLGPGSWWNVRNALGGGGRDRAQRISWLLVVIGVANFFYWLWKKVGKQVRTRMEQAAQEVLEVGVEGDDDDDGGNT